MHVRTIGNMHSAMHDLKATTQRPPLQQVLVSSQTSRHTSELRQHHQLPKSEYANPRTILAPPTLKPCLLPPQPCPSTPLRRRSRSSAQATARWKRKSTAQVGAPAYVFNYPQHCRGTTEKTEGSAERLTISTGRYQPERLRRPRWSLLRQVDEGDRGGWEFGGVSGG